jgi:hypothetical protein
VAEYTSADFLHDIPEEEWDGVVPLDLCLNDIPFKVY